MYQEYKLDEPVVSHDKPGAADHRSVDWDVLFNPIMSILGFCPNYYMLLVLVFNIKKLKIKHKKGFFCFIRKIYTPAFFSKV